jgi:hypothetical protein
VREGETEAISLVVDIFFQTIFFYRDGVREGEADKFSFYDGIGHRNVFALPKWSLSLSL